MKAICVTILLLLIFQQQLTLKVDHQGLNYTGEVFTHAAQSSKTSHTQSDKQCSKQLCLSKFGLMEYPFSSHCNQDAACWKKWFGFPDCKEDDSKCWKVSVGYPKECNDDDYDCWIKAYNFSSCEDANCLKKYLNYTCGYDDIPCWKKQNFWIPQCSWNDWDCWIKNSFFDVLCDEKKGYDCVQILYGGKCKKDDEKCWRQQFLLPDADCEKNADCFKKYYFLPICKDDDFDCWKGYYWGPNCKKGDMNCLKNLLFIPDCTSQKQQIKCYKKWLGYPDCKPDDGKCWKEFDQKNAFSNQFILRWDHIKSTQDHKQTPMHDISFGKLMQHKRKLMGQGHKMQRQYHKKKAQLD